MRKINMPLLIGSFILLLIVFVMLFPRAFTDQSPYTIQHMRFTSVEGASVIERAPYPPSQEMLMGSDDMGRDIFSYIVFGTRLTITLGILVALGQFFIAIPLGILAGFGHTGVKSFIAQFSIIFSAIPALLISIIILRLDFFASLDKGYSILAFVIVLSLIGWPKLSNLITQRVSDINQQPFIRGAVAIGKKRRHIAFENVMPHLIPELVVLFFMEVARNLALIMQLGIFGVFVGNLRILLSSDQGQLIYYKLSFEPEWASMLSTSRNMISTAPWAIIFPAMAFFLSVLGFNLFGEGIRNHLQKKDTQGLSYQGKMKTFKIISLWRQTGRKLKVISIVLLAVVFVFVWLGTSGSRYRFELSDVAEINYNQVVIGTDEAETTANMIASEMADLGLEPMDDEAYIMSYEIGESLLLESQTFVIDSNGRQLEAGVDYTIIGTDQQSHTGAVLDASKDDLYSIKDYGIYENRFILIDTQYYNQGAINYLIDDISSHVSIEGVLLISENKDIEKQYLIKATDNMMIIAISSEIATILSLGDSNISVHGLAVELGQTGHNVVGIYRGEDAYLGDEAILLGFNYNYMSDTGKEVLAYNIEIMKQLCMLEHNKRSIIFMFLDGTISESSHGIYPLSEDFPYSTQKIKVYIDLTGITGSRFDRVEFSNVQAPVTRPLPWGVGHYLERELVDAFQVDELEAVFMGGEYFFTESYADNAMYWDRGVATIILNTNEYVDGKSNLQDISEILLEVIDLNNY